MGKMSNTNIAKIVVAVVLLILAIILVIQNREPVETWILFTSVTMPRALLLVLTTALGFLSGWLLARYQARR